MALQHIALEVFNVGGWLTHGIFALEAEVDYLAVVEHRLIPARAWQPFGHLPLKIPLMLEMLVLGLSV